MKIDSGLSGYQYPNRTVEVERKQEEAPQTVTASVSRSQGALTGSSTLLSSSLASALWGMTTGDGAPAAPQAEAAPQDWVQNLYQEFA
jgi:predicted ATPase